MAQNAVNDYLHPINSLGLALALNPKHLKPNNIAIQLSIVPHRYRMQQPMKLLQRDLQLPKLDILAIGLIGGRLFVLVYYAFC